MELVRMLAGPLIGAVIGYFTNYIAVKMLFRPLHPVKIGNWTLPFTPGIIPRGKERLAKALGSAVGDKLITKEDLEGVLLSDGVKQVVVENISKGLQNAQNREDTVESFLMQYVSAEDYGSIQDKLGHFVTEKITDGINKLDVGAIIAEEGAKEVKRKMEGTMFAMFANDDLINSIAEPIGRKVGEFIKESGQEKIYPIVAGEITGIGNKSIGEIAGALPMKDDKFRTVVEKIYVDFVGSKAGEFAEKFEVTKIVEEKVNEMDVREVEDILMSIMKKELNAVINLGALIGVVIGLLNLFI